jgi:hypothetical protein
MLIALHTRSFFPALTWICSHYLPSRITRITDSLLLLQFESWRNPWSHCNPRSWRGICRLEVYRTPNRISSCISPCDDFRRRWWLTLSLLEAPLSCRGTVPARRRSWYLFKFHHLPHQNSLRFDISLVYLRRLILSHNEYPRSRLRHPPPHSPHYSTPRFLLGCGIEVYILSRYINAIAKSSYH